MSEGKQSIIGRSMVITGDVECGNNLVLKGKINGVFSGTGLLIADTGYISGSITGENIECFGRIEGDVVTGSFALRKTAFHAGTAETGELEVDLGAILDCALQNGVEKVQKPERDNRQNLKSTSVALSTLSAAFQEEGRPCCMEIPWSGRYELYGQIVDLLNKGKPLLKVTGESGSGKSLLIQKVLNSLPDNYKVLLISDQIGAVANLVRGVAADLGIDTDAVSSQKALIARVKDVLKEKNLCGQKMVLLVDDAHLMYPATMEGIIRQLTTAYGDGEGEKLLQMILLGTKNMESQMVPTTIEYFEDETNCQLHLDPLSIKDTAEYLLFCLQLAAREEKVDCASLLPYETIRKIHSMSRGNIAEINRLADSALQLAIKTGAKSVAPGFVISPPPEKQKLSRAKY